MRILLVMILGGLSAPLLLPAERSSPEEPDRPGTEQAAPDGACSVGCTPTVGPDTELTPRRLERLLARFGEDDGR